jgi:hypothetical protein
MVAAAVAIPVRVRGEALTLSFTEAVELYRKLAGDTEDSKRTALQRAVREGAFLLQVRAGLPHGTWARWLAETGINEKTAGNRARLAAALATEHGELSREKLAEGVRKWNESHAGNPTLEIDADTLSIRRCEVIFGIRAEGRKPGQHPETFGTSGSDLTPLLAGAGTRASRASDYERQFEALSTDELEAMASDYEELEAGGPASAGLLSPHAPPGPSAVGSSVAARPRAAPATGPQLTLAGEYEAVDADAQAIAAQLLRAGGDTASRCVAAAMQYRAALEAIAREAA